MALPPDTRAAGDAGHVADHNSIVDEFLLIQYKDHRWAASKAYKAGQLVVNGGTLYVANIDFTSGSTFDATNLTAIVAGGGGGGAGVTTFNTRSGAVTLTKADVTGTGLAASDVGATPSGSAQPLDADLTVLAAMDSATAGMIATDGGGWIKKTYAQVKTALGLTKADVGLSNVDNTSDASKPVSTATASALAAKANLGSNAFTGTQDFTGATVTGVAGTNLLLNAGATVPAGTPVGTIIYQKLA